MIDNLLNIISTRSQLSKPDLSHIKGMYDKNPSSFFDKLFETKLLMQDDIYQSFGQLYDLKYQKRLMTQNCDADWTEHLSKQFLKQYSMVPLVQKTGVNTENHITIAIHNPAHISITDDLSSVFHTDRFSIILSPREQIISAINHFYDHSQDDARQLVEDVEDNEYLILEDIEKTADLLDDAGDAPVIRLVNHMISKGIKSGSSDIHIEPFQEDLRVRYRIDGMLYEMLTPPKAVQASLISRIKVMAKMNIAEKRIPQDGRAQVRLGNQEIDIRISTVPTAFGERLVMRLLNKSDKFLKLDQFGLSDKNRSLLAETITQTNGIVLVTGPTGSGKTTTLYAGLSEINSREKNIITIEDPIEYNLKEIGQIQVNAKTGVTFAKGLRSIVRQDPDIILIGEIRDIETADIAIQSALTGHLVFSTLHTNDSAGAITRLADLGVEPYLITSSVNTVIAQRLVRLLCNNCKKEHIIGPSDVISLNGSSEDYIGKKIFKPCGCPKCFDTGYSGRQPIFEIMVLDEMMKSIILKTSDANQIKDQALKMDMRTLRQDGMDKVLQGKTSIGEVLRVTQE